MPGILACGSYPVPLDDVYIHFDFARAVCRGHPFEWIAGQGYSSGETSPLYAAVLAVGYALGFHEHLAWFAGGVAVASVAWAMGSLRALLRREPVALAGAGLLVSVGALGFTLFSGMEFALFLALVLRAFVLGQALTRIHPPGGRARAAWRLGVLGALIVWTRPEGAVVVAVLAFLAARHARSASPWAALARVALPGSLAMGAVAALNLAFTGDWASAGARLKLLSSNPYLTDAGRAREALLNLFHFLWRVVDGSMVAGPRWLVPFLATALLPLVARGTRDVGVALVLSAVLYAGLVSLNGAARYQGFRYYAPAVGLGVAAVALGASTLGRTLGTGLTLVFALGAASRALPQVRFFRDASENIHDQQVRAGLALRSLPPGRVLVNDAGAIPYVSERSAIDGLGLGGFHRLPFTRAALSGEASTVELLQRLPPAERPSLLAIYPNWFPGVTAHFVARELDRVTLTHNVICGGPVKLLAVADWSALDQDAPVPALDELDVADIESEAAHAYELPSAAGWTVLDVREGAFDGGRIVPAGARESFVVQASARRARLVVRSDRAVDALARVPRPLVLRAPERSGWITAATEVFAVERGMRIVLEATAPLRDFHVWITSAE